MSHMTLLEILNTVQQECGFLTSANFTASGNADDLQMVALANRAVNSLRERDFSRSTARYTITLTSSESYALPSDFLEIVPDTMMIVGRVDGVNFPTRADYWEYLKSTSGPTGYTVNARMMDGSLKVFQPTAGEVLAFEYVSNSPVLSVDGFSPLPKFQNDGDMWLLDDDLLVLETRWRFLAAKGLPDWDAVKQECKEYRNSVMGREKGSQTLRGIPIIYTGDPWTNLWANG